jgi:ribosomal-protein-alanine N-acetyltransferase
MLAPGLTSDSISSVWLSPFEESDVDEQYVAWMQDPAVIRFTEVEAGSATLENCRDYVRSNNVSAAAFLWRIITADEGHVGNIRLQFTPKHRRGELALIVGRTDLHGQGIGTGAICVVSDYAFSTLKLHKLTCGIYASNQGSRAAFAKRGYQVEATFREHVVLDGRFEDVLRLACFG